MGNESIDQAVFNELHNLTPCPRKGYCVSGIPLPDYSCSMYGCSIEREHATFERVSRINGNKDQRSKIFALIDIAIKTREYSFREKSSE